MKKARPVLNVVVFEKRRGGGGELTFLLHLPLHQFFKSTSPSHQVHIAKLPCPHCQVVHQGHIANLLSPLHPMHHTDEQQTAHN